MMKNIMKAAAIALAALTIASCTGKKFQVNGTISDAKDSLLYFENMSLQEGVVVLDSVKLGENGEFSFSEAAPEAPELPFAHCQPDHQHLDRLHRDRHREGLLSHHGHSV